jgi:hypothetical protein
MLMAVAVADLTVRDNDLPIAAQVIASIIISSGYTLPSRSPVRKWMFNPGPSFHKVSAKRGLATWPIAYAGQQIGLTRVRLWIRTRRHFV